MREPEQSQSGAAILGFRIDLVSCRGAGVIVGQWARNGESRVVLAANVHMVMEARDQPGLLDQLRGADLVVPDGRPLVWALRLHGVHAEQVRGADLMREVCHQAEAQGIPVGLYGASAETQEALQCVLRREYPNLQIAFAFSPPYRDLTPAEDEGTVCAIGDSGARILFVSLGCPKQERWMIDHRGRLPCVMLGVGAAFDFLAGTVSEAPRWMQRLGLEWLFRLLSEPTRLWKRYLKHNPRFAALVIAELFRPSQNKQ